PLRPQPGAHPHRPHAGLRPVRPAAIAGGARPGERIPEVHRGHGRERLGPPNTLITANSEARISGVYGVLKLTLSDGSYSWQFIPVGGSGPTDSGTGACH